MDARRAARGIELEGGSALDCTVRMWTSSTSSALCVCVCVCDGADALLCRLACTDPQPQAFPAKLALQPDFLIINWDGIADCLMGWLAMASRLGRSDVDARARDRWTSTSHLMIVHVTDHETLGKKVGKWLMC